MKEDCKHYDTCQNKNDSACCGMPIIMGDICQGCGEHTDSMCEGCPDYEEYIINPNGKV